MEKLIKQYELVVSNAWEISQTVLDMEGGRYVLVMFIELVQELLGEGNISGAVAVMRKLYETAEVTFEQCVLAEGDSGTCVALFSDALGDTLESTAF